MSIIKNNKGKKVSQLWGFIYFIISLLYKLDVHNDTYKNSDLLFYVVWIVMGNFQVSNGSQTQRCVKMMVQGKKITKPNYQTH